MVRLGLAVAITIGPLQLHRLCFLVDQIWRLMGFLPILKLLLCIFGHILRSAIVLGNGGLVKESLLIVFDDGLELAAAIILCRFAICPGLKRVVVVLFVALNGFKHGELFLPDGIVVFDPFDLGVVIGFWFTVAGI